MIEKNSKLVDQKKVELKDNSPELDAVAKKKEENKWECEDECLEEKDDTICGETDHL